MSKVSETDEEDKCVDRTEGMSDDDAESVDEPKSANDRRTDNADADSSLDRLSLPLASHHSVLVSYIIKIGSVCLCHGQHAVDDRRYFLAPCGNRPPQC